MTFARLEKRAYRHTTIFHKGTHERPLMCAFANPIGGFGDGREIELQGRMSVKGSGVDWAETWKGTDHSACQNRKTASIMV